MKSSGNFILKNEVLQLELSPANGAIAGIKALESGWEILNRPHLGLSFQLLLPLPGRRNNPVYGEKQPVSSVEVNEDHSHARLVWDSVTSEYGGRHDIKLVLNVSMNKRNAVFSLEIANNSEYTIESVHCPYFGDIQHPSGEELFKAFYNCYNTAFESSLWPIFENKAGFWSVDHPTQYSTNFIGSAGVPTAPFILLRGAKQGLYVGVAEPLAEMVAWFSELYPGHKSSMEGTVPDGLNIDGKDVATRFAAVHAPYILAGETRSLAPVAIEPYHGGWQEGVDIYKAWRSSRLEAPVIPEWVREPHSWQQIHINSPEDELRIKYKDLVKIGEDCARHGVKGIQLTGWNHGGQDQFNPTQDTDPRLGTYEELKEAIARIRAMGVKVILFSKYTWADRATERFRKDLIRLAAKDPYGDYYMGMGCAYQTIPQLLAVNLKAFVPMCFLSEEYLQVCDMEFKKVLGLEPDGILFDECMHHHPSLFCFDMSHGHRYGAPVFAKDNKLIDNFSALAPRDRDFLFAGEGCYDWEFQKYHISYFRSTWQGHVPLSRYILPDVPLMTAVMGFDDRNMINQCLLYRYIISYEPFYFKGRLDDFPSTLEYGKKMDDLRTELREYFWDGEFRDECGAHVTLEDGSVHRPYSVFVNRQTNKKGLVIANYSGDKTITAKVEMKDGSKPGRYRLVDVEEWKQASEGIQIPPYSAAVIIP